MLEKLFLIQKVFAQIFGSSPEETGVIGSSPRAPTVITNPLNNIDTVSELITKILTIIIQIGLPLIALAIVYDGFLFIKAQGNESELAEAKKALLWTVIGAGVILGAFVIRTAIQGTITNLGG
ncbi:MAG: hypothetical protein AAB505_02515 [Patescibacteria group bacterium]